MGLFSRLFRFLGLGGKPPVQEETPAPAEAPPKAPPRIAPATRKRGAVAPPPPQPAPEQPAAKKAPVRKTASGSVPSAAKKTSGVRHVRRVRHTRSSGTLPALGPTPVRRPTPQPTRAPETPPRPAAPAKPRAEDEEDFLKNLDTMLKESDRATTQAGVVEYDTGTRLELQQLFEQMLPEYVPPIRECLVKIKGGNQSKIIIESLLGAITPLIFAAEHVDASDTYTALKRLKEPLERGKKTGTQLSRDDVKGMIREYNKIVIQLKEARKKYGESGFVRTKAAPVAAAADQEANLETQGAEPALLDILSKIEGIGGDQIERLYAAGLTTVATLREATVKDVMDLTGIDASLALQIVRAVYESKAK